MVPFTKNAKKKIILQRWLPPPITTTIGGNSHKCRWDLETKQWQHILAIEI